MSEKPANAERKVTFREVFGLPEYRAIFTSTQLAWIGEYMSKSAVMALVFGQTGSVTLSAAAFAVSFAPWLVGGPFLAALAERYRYRQVMVTCDVLRAVLIALVAVPGMPLPAMLVLVFTAALLAPPGQAARSATLPLVLTGERVVLGLAINQSSGQATQVVGYFTGAVVAIIDPRVALLVNAAAFLLSAAILRFGLRDRPPAMRAEHRSHLLRETGEGFRVVFGTPALRVIAVLVFTSMLFSIVPEGLAIGWANELAEGADTRQGFYQGMIMVANPVGYAFGVLLTARLLLPTVRRRMVPYLAVLAPLALVPALADPGILGVVAMATLSGLAMAGMTPTLNGMFVQALPNGFRARAFGVMNSGMQTLQGGAIFVTGLLVGLVGDNRLHQVVGLWCLAGVLIMLLLAVRWPRPSFFEDAIRAAEAANRTTDPTPATAGPGPADPDRGPGPDPADPADPQPSGAGGATPGRPDPGDGTGRSSPRQSPVPQPRPRSGPAPADKPAPAPPAGSSRADRT